MYFYNRVFVTHEMYVFDGWSTYCVNFSWPV